jgi:cobalt-zinc-cadmium efflux system membrane fusion protein
MMGRCARTERVDRRARWLMLALLAGTSGACGSPAPQTRDEPAIRPDGRGGVIVRAESPVWERLRIEPVRLEPWSDQLEMPARVQPDPRRVWRVTLPVPGRVIEVHVSAGDAVRRGQSLLTIASPEADGALAAVRQADAARRAAEAAIRQAQADVERLRDLLEHDAVARREVLHAETALAQAEAERARTEAAAAQARDTLAILDISPEAGASQVVIRAPRTGRVMHLAVAPGEFHADTSLPLLQMADLSTVWLVSDVPEHRLAAVEPNVQVEVSFVAFPGERFAGRVTRVGDALDPETRTLKLYMELPNPDGRLRPEMFATIQVRGAPRDVAVVPADAVVRAGGGAAVVVADPEQGRFVGRAVRLGRPRAGRVPVLDGLESGEQVVVDGALLLVNAGLRLPSGSATASQTNDAVVASRVVLASDAPGTTP